MVKKSSLVSTILLSIFVVVMASDCMVYATLAVDAYVFVAPPVCVANALGEVFIVEMNISSAQNLRAFEFKLGYNATLLDALQVVQGPFFPSPPRASVERLEINETMGFVWIRISLPGSEPPIGGSGTLATITFNVTLAPVPPEEACCALDLYDTLLYDGSMKAIIHDSADGLYFWSSIQVDPPVEGRLLDINTQKGGIGQGTFGGTFMMGEMVELSVNLTYNGYPVGSKLVSFQVLNPKNKTILAQAAFSDSEGFAAINFSIAFITESLGTWTAFATAQVADEVVWDFLTFVVISSAPSSPIAKFIEIPQAPFVNQQVCFDASASQLGFDGDDECPIAEYRWDFGDGNQTNTTAPIIYHTYLHAGIYYVTLAVYAPGKPPNIDPQYIDTNTTYPPERKVVCAVPVGGYSQSAEKYTGLGPMVPYFVLEAILTVSLALLKRKKPKRKQQTLLFSGDFQQ